MNNFYPGDRHTILPDLNTLYSPLCPLRNNQVDRLEPIKVGQRNSEILRCSFNSENSVIGSCALWGSGRWELRPPPHAHPPEKFQVKSRFLRLP